MAECGETKAFGKKVVFTCNMVKGHEGFHSDSAVYNDTSWWHFRWGNANDMVVPEKSDQKWETE